MAAQAQPLAYAPFGSPEPVSGIPIEPAVQGPIPEFDLPVSSIEFGQQRCVWPAWRIRRF